MLPPPAGAPSHADAVLALTPVPWHQSHCGQGSSGPFPSTSWGAGAVGTQGPGGLGSAGPSLGCGGAGGRAAPSTRVPAGRRYWGSTTASAAWCRRTCWPYTRKSAVLSKRSTLPRSTAALSSATGRDGAAAGTAPGTALRGWAEGSSVPGACRYGCEVPPAVTFDENLLEETESLAPGELQLNELTVESVQHS